MTYKPTTDDLIDTYVIWHLQSYRNRTVDVAQQAERDLRAQAEKTLAAHDAEVRAQALREAADKIHVSLQRAHKRDGRPLDPMFSLHDQGLWDGYKNAENWLRDRADRIERGE